MLVLAAVASAMSIEAEPVKVTHRNSGPRYDIDEVEKTKLTSANQERAPQQPADDRQPAGGAGPSDRVPESSPPASSSSEDEAATPIGHVAIRRIFLFPMMRPGDWSQQDQSEGGPATGPREAQPQPGRGEQESGEHEQPIPSLFAKPFWPFMTPARPSPAMHHHEGHEERPIRPVHLFGADEASRPPMGERDQDKAESGPEREQTRPGLPPVFDPIQMMVDLMHQAINSQLPPNFTTDLNKNKNTDSNNKGDREMVSTNDNAPAESSDERPLMPGLGGLMPTMPRGAKNESHEDIVEIEGKKYLRKVVINRHVGDNIMFMTRRLIFVPLNETDSAPTTTDTVATSATDSAPTTRPQVSGVESETATAPVASAANDRVGTNKPQPTVGETAGTSEPTPASSPTTEQTSPSPTTTEAPITTTTTTTTTTSPTTTMAPEQPATSSSGESNVEPTTEPKMSPSSEPTSVPSSGRASERLVEENNNNNNNNKQTPAANEGPEKLAEGA